MIKVIKTTLRYWKPLLALNSLIIAATIASAVLSPKVWTATTQLILPDSTTSSDANLGTLGSLESNSVDFSNEVNPLKVQSSILTSKDVLSRLWEADPEKSEFSSLDSYKKLFKATPIDQATNITVEVKGSTPELARQRTERLVNIYQERLNQLRWNVAADRNQFTKQQLEAAQIKLIQAQNQLTQFKRATGLVNSEEQTKNLVAAINGLATTQTEILAQSKAFEAQTRVLAQRIGMLPNQVIDSLRLTESPEYQSLRQKISEVETALAQARGTYQDDSPQVQSLLKTRQELYSAQNNRLQAVVGNAKGLDTSFGGNPSKNGSIELTLQLITAESQAQGLRQQANQIQNKLNELRGSLSSISTQQSQLLDLQRKYDIAEGVYKGIVTQLQQADISAFNSYPNVQILDQPSVETKPTSPKRSLIALGGLLASLFGSAALVLSLESRNTLLSPKDVQEMELPILVRIPRLKRSKLNWDQVETEVEFQRLASAISLIPLENRRLMVTSSTVGEGKTTITLRLALALVDFGFKVLVVDGDLRKAGLSQILGYSKSDKLEIPSIVKVRPNLDLMPTIPRDSKVVGFVARGDFERNLSAVQETGNYDYIIVDSAPVSLTSETALMIGAIPNVLMVVRLGVSDRNLVNDTLEQLNRHHAQIIGLAINDVETKNEGYLYRNEYTPKINA